MSGLEPPTSLDWLPAYSNQLNYTAPFLVFYVATIVAILIVYPTIPAAPGCPWSPHFLVPTQYTLALWYRHFLSFLDAVRYGGVCVKFSKSVEGGGIEPPAHRRFLKHQPIGWVWFICRLPHRFCFFLPYSGAGGLEPPLIQGFGDTAERRCARLLTIPLIPIWLLLLPAFCPRFRAPHGGR